MHKKCQMGIPDYSTIRTRDCPGNLVDGYLKKRLPLYLFPLFLQKFAPAEEKILKKVTKKNLEGLEMIVNESPEKAMNFINQN